MGNLPDPQVPPELNRSEKLAAQSGERGRTRKVVVQASTSSNDRPAITTGGAMSVAEFCRSYCIGRTKLYAEVKAGRLRLRKLGSKTIIARSDAEEWLNSLPNVAAS